MNLSRRRFIGLSAGAAALGALSRPVTVQGKEQENLEEQLQRAADRPVLQISELKEPVLIESIDLLFKDGDYFVRVRSKDGAEGVSVDNGRADVLYPILKEKVIPYFIGKDARQLEEHLFGVYRHASNYKFQGLALWCPVAWVELAILDLLGRIAGKSMGEILGGVIRKRIAYYIASGNRHTTPEEEVEYLQELVRDTGAHAVKFRVGGRMSRDRDSMPGRTEKLIPLSRKVLGDRIAIHADSNSSYSPAKAIEVGRMLENINAVYFEEPCPFDHLEETRQVTEALDLPVAGGEQEFSQWRFKWQILHRAVDIVQPDIQYYGGMIRSIRVANMAEVREMPTTVHISGGFGFVYMLHFASRTPLIGPWQEYKKSIDKYGDWFQPRLKAMDGKMTVPEGPGVGIAEPKEILKDANTV